MSYTGRKKFKTAREKNQSTFRNMKAFLLILIAASLVYCIKNRVAIMDYINTYFY